MLIAAAALGIGVTACSGGESRSGSSSTSNCQLLIEGASYFIGEERCYRQYPVRRMSGFWVAGFEYSAFYRDLASIPKGFDPAATSLDLSEDAHASAKTAFDGAPKIFEITFEGIEPEIDGFYGHLGNATRGVFVDHFLSLRQVP